MINAYPLCWPTGRPQTQYPARSRFSVRLSVARDSLIAEIRILGGRQIIISTNIPVRLDGLPYASAKEPDNSGVAVYFTYRNEQVCFACDKWNRVKDNIQAVRKTIESLRGIARWGTGDMMERAFTGFAKLPDPDNTGGESWYVTLDCANTDNFESVQLAYRRAVSKSHPDKGGTSDQYRKVQEAWLQAKQQLGHSE